MYAHLLLDVCIGVGEQTVVVRSSCTAADEPSTLQLDDDVIPARSGSIEQDLYRQDPAHREDGAALCPETAETVDGGPTGHEGEFSGTYWLLRRLGNRWTIPILSALRKGPVRFARLKRALDSVSQRMLTLSLRRLEHDGLIYREEISGQPPQVRYGLAPLGLALVERLDDFDRWLAAHAAIAHPPLRN
jgi:DNA-binding HxlR family transcriptional regulator